MKQTLISLVAALGVALLPPVAEAANSKSKPATAKTSKSHASAKHVKPTKAAKVHAVSAKKKITPVARKAVPEASALRIHEDSHHLVLQSSAALVQDQATGAVLFEKNAGAILPIASISKLMTAMVTLDAKPNLQETMVIGEEDVDSLKGTRSRLKVGTQLPKEDMLRLALMSSENRAAASLSRYYPGGRPAFVAAMNRKAAALGLTGTHFEDSTGLTSANVSTAKDLVRMVAAAHQYPLIREFTTTAEYEVSVAGRTETFRNTNPLVRTQNQNDWEIGLSKTGYINEAGKCLVMQAWFNNKPTIIVLLDSWGKLTRIGDANRIKRWIESASVGHKTRAS
ncbi:MAG TPA: D-alanyl-D-alanine endopeptidase [Rhodocyclaceae bacterium]|jgi:D-alanyl-D-alanine endopeptidase (penicillin-binding protein 7)